MSIKLVMTGPNNNPFIAFRLYEFVFLHEFMFGSAESYIILEPTLSQENTSRAIFQIIGIIIQKRKVIQ